MHLQFSAKDLNTSLANFHSHNMIFYEAWRHMPTDSYDSRNLKEEASNRLPAEISVSYHHQFFRKKYVFTKELSALMLSLAGGPDPFEQTFIH